MGDLNQKRDEGERLDTGQRDQALDVAPDTLHEMVADVGGLSGGNAQAEALGGETEQRNEQRTGGNASTEGLNPSMTPLSGDGVGPDAGEGSSNAAPMGDLYGVGDGTGAYAGEGGGDTSGLRDSSTPFGGDGMLAGDPSLYEAGEGAPASGSTPQVSSNVLDDAQLAQYVGLVEAGAFEEAVLYLHEVVPHLQQIDLDLGVRTDWSVGVSNESTGADALTQLHPDTIEYLTNLYSAFGNATLMEALGYPLEAAVLRVDDIVALVVEGEREALLSTLAAFESETQPAALDEVRSRITSQPVQALGAKAKMLLFVTMIRATDIPPEYRKSEIVVAQAALINGGVLISPDEVVVTMSHEHEHVWSNYRQGVDHFPFGLGLDEQNLLGSGVKAEELGLDVVAALQANAQEEFEAHIHELFMRSLLGVEALSGDAAGEKLATIVDYWSKTPDEYRSAPENIGLLVANAGGLLDTYVNAWSGPAQALGDAFWEGSLDAFISGAVTVGDGFELSDSKKVLAEAMRAEVEEIVWILLGTGHRERFKDYGVPKKYLIAIGKSPEVRAVMDALDTLPAEMQTMLEDSEEHIQAPLKALVTAIGVVDQATQGYATPEQARQKRTVLMKDRVLVKFEFGSDEVSKGSGLALSQKVDDLYAKSISDGSIKGLEIIGFSDDRPAGDEQAQRALSKARALAVQEYLQQRLGPDLWSRIEGRVKVSGEGYKPSNDKGLEYSKTLRPVEDVEGEDAKETAREWHRRVIVIPIKK